jgi:hypothetical protein
MYYRKGTYYYQLLLNELKKIDLSVCDQLKNHLNKMRGEEDDDDDDEDTDADDKKSKKIVDNDSDDDDF